MKLKQPLLGERIVIRDYTPEDLAFSTDMWFDPENGKYLSDPTREYVDEVFQRALDGLQDSKDGYYLIAELRSGGERIGTCCAFPDKDVYDIGYCIHKSRWKQGFGTEVVNLLMSWVRDQGGTAVTAEAAEENRASCALLEKCGFAVVRESSFKKYHMDVSFDSFIYEKKL
ncbi:MAG: GNAT family N-acetyltransferase [Oscillibacter sp.]|nr:GNAT family N-acetyltransferase [Oscillibacter sp.]